jgi:hypothetical protein
MLGLGSSAAIHKQPRRHGDVRGFRRLSATRDVVIDAAN